MNFNIDEIVNTKGYTVHAICIHILTEFLYFIFQSGGVYDDLGDDRLTFGSTSTVNDVVVSGATPVMVTTGAESFYPTTIRGQYSIAPATTIVNGHQKTYHTIVNVAPPQPKNL